MKISKKKITCDYNLSDKDHIDNRHILSFRCPICHNKTVYDVEKDVYSLPDVGYDDLFVCEECGAEMYGRQKYDGTIQFQIITDDIEECTEINSSLDIDEASSLQSEIYTAAKEILMSPEYGFLPEDVKDYLFVDSEVVEDNFLRIEVRAELSYDGLLSLANELNPIVQSIDPDAYFDLDQPGIMSTFISLDNISACITSATDIDDDGPLPKLGTSFSKWVEDNYGVEDTQSLPKDEFDEYYQEYKGTMKAVKNLHSKKAKVTSSSNTDIQFLSKAAAHVTSDDDLFDVISSLQSIDKKLYLKYSEMARSGGYSPAAIGKMISDDLYYLSGDSVSASMSFDDWLYRRNGVISEDNFTDEDYNSEFDQYQMYREDEDARDDIYSYEDINDDEDVNLDEYEYCGNKDGYQIYRKIVRDENGKPHGEWATQDQDRNYPPFRITYMQALGYDPIDKYDSDVKKLGRELGRMLLPNSSTSVKASKYKRISRYREFDNGNVLFDYQDMDDDTAEDMARQASLDDPDDVYYVKYDDVMNPDSDYRWYQGNKYNWSDIKYKNGRYQPVTSAEDPEFEEYEDEIKEIDQEFTSENTSINSTKLPAVFKMVSFEPGTVNIDYGGGRFDNVADYLSQYDVINLVYDPYNRTPEHNKEVIKLVREHGGADTATCSNVLNVIKEPEVRLNVLNNIKKLVKSSGEVYITVYEGSGKGNEGATKSGYQLNRKTADYLEEIQQVFPDAKRKGKLIIAHPSGSVNSSVTAARKPKYWNTMFRNKVVDAYEKGELSFDNIEEWETECNDGIKPVPSLGTKEILDYYVSHPEAVSSSIDLSNYSPGYVELRDGQPSFVYDNYEDARRGASYSQAGDSMYDMGTHEYNIRYWNGSELSDIDECNSVKSASSFGEDSDTYFQVYSLTGDGELEDHLEDFDDLNAAISYAKEVCEDGPCEVVEIEATDRGLQQSVCHISADGSVTYLDEKSVLSASYGGAYDIEDDMFFTRDDINEFGYQVAALFSEECGEEFELSDIYMDDPVNLHIQVSRDGIDLSADVKIDMRRIRSPRDLDKYADPVIDQLHRAYQEDYLPYVSGSCVKSASKLDPKVPDDEFIMDGGDEVMASYQDVDRMRDRWLDPPDYDEPIEVDDEDVEVELLLDADIEIDGEGNWDYLDDSYPWVDESDLEFDSFDYPAIKLDDVTGAVEKVDELLIEKMPFDSGKYHIKGDVILVYNISGVEYDESYEGPDEDGQPSVSKEYYMDNTDVTWLRDKSRINNFEFDRIR